MSEYFAHTSVLFRESLDFMGLDAPEFPVFADLTFGAGGHTVGMAQAYPTAKIYSTDQDPEAYSNGLKLIERLELKERIKIFNTNFENFSQLALEESLSFDGILMDLGVSSHHFDSFERGFSFREDAPLDMRMNNLDESVPTAAHILNSFLEEELADIFFELGEEKFSRRIAKRVVEARATKSIQSTKELEEICFLAYPKNLRHKKTHPATRAFQGLRIYVNRELEVLRDSLEDLWKLLRPNGTLVVISFHSLEDRIVKHKFREIFQNDKKAAKILTKRPLTPSKEELAENKRSRSAKLRVIQKL